MLLSPWLLVLLTLQPPTNKITLPPQIITNIQKESKRESSDAEKLRPEDGETLEAGLHLGVNEKIYAYGGSEEHVAETGTPRF